MPLRKHRKHEKRLGPPHENAYRIVKGGAAEHRLVMEETLERSLASHELVHHKNGVRWDNRPQNLELWTKGGHPIGQRVEDLAAWVVEVYPEIVLEKLAEEKPANSGKIFPRDLTRADCDINLAT